MSLTRIAVRMALVEALKGQTLVGDNVRDSVIGALEVRGDGALRSDEEKPFIAVYTDAAKVENDIELRSLKENGLTEIVLEWGVTTAMLVTDDDSGETTIVGLPATDDALEFNLDLVGRQIRDVLTDPDNAWAEIYRGLCFRYFKVERARAANAENGIRVAGQQLKLTAALADDPVPGEDVPEVFSQFFALLDGSGDPHLLAKSTLMQAQLSGSAEDWAVLQRRLGMTADELKALGRGPLEATETGAAPVMTEVTLDVEAHGQETVT